jgi:hypothetical protein
LPFSPLSRLWLCMSPAAPDVRPHCRVALSVHAHRKVDQGCSAVVVVWEGVCQVPPHALRESCLLCTPHQEMFKPEEVTFQATGGGQARYTLALSPRTEGHVVGKVCHRVCEEVLLVWCWRWCLQ